MRSLDNLIEAHVLAAEREPFLVAALAAVLIYDQQARHRCGLVSQRLCCSQNKTPKSRWSCQMAALEPLYPIYRARSCVRGFKLAVPKFRRSRLGFSFACGAHHSSLYAIQKGPPLEKPFHSTGGYPCGRRKPLIVRDFRNEGAGTLQAGKWCAIPGCRHDCGQRQGDGADGYASEDFCAGEIRS